MGKVPGRPEPYQLSQPGAASLWGTPSRSGVDSDSNTAIVHSYYIKPMLDDHHRQIKPGDLVFATRTGVRTDNGPDGSGDRYIEPLTTMVELHVLNSILSRGYYQCLENMAPDHTPPSEHALWISDYAGRPHADLMRNGGSEGTAPREQVPPRSVVLARLLEDRDFAYGLSAELRADMTQRIASYQADEAKQELAFNLFNAKKESTDEDGLLYLTLGGIRGLWNWIGSVQTTDNDTGTSYQRGRPFPVVNAVLQKKARIYNRWSDELVEGAHLYLTLRRRRDVGDTYHEFQIVPWYSNERYPPPHDELVYRDLAGEVHVGHYWFVGTVIERLSANSGSHQRRVTSLGIGKTTRLEAFNAKCTLDYVWVSLSV
jgi:hypothetical protein